MTQAELLSLDPLETDYVLGLFGENHMEFDNERQEGRDPSIKEMTSIAVQARPRLDDVREAVG